MRTYKYLIVTIIMGLSFTSCNDFLDPDPTDRLSEKLFWQNEESTDLYLNSFLSIFIIIRQFRNITVQ